MCGLPGWAVYSGISGAPGEPLMYLWGVNWRDLIHWWEHDWFVCGSISHDEGGQGEEPDQGAPGVWRQLKECHGWRQRCVLEKEGKS